MITMPPRQRLNDSEYEFIKIVVETHSEILMSQLVCFASYGLDIKDLTVDMPIMSLLDYSGLHDQIKAIEGGLV